MALVLSAMAHLLLLLLLFRQAQSLQWDYSVVQDTGMSTSPSMFVCGQIYPFVQLPLQFGRSILDFGRLIFFYTHLDKLYVRETLP